jgi:carboxypeptidase C (cathepsin A)
VRFQPAFCLLIFYTMLALPTVAQEPSPGQPPEAGILRLLPPDATTDHVLQARDGQLPFKATAGTLDLFGQDGNRNAKVFYTAYQAKERALGRPVTFVFNGGPGAASAYLHLGLVGPQILPFEGENTDGTRPQLKDNPESWLAFTDLVLLDPVGTGWSRAVNDEAAGGYLNVRQDAESIAKVIALYIRKNNLLAAPKYLLGESYGGFRAAKVALAMKNSQSMVPSGIIMLSPLIEGRFIFGADDDPLAASLQFSALAAAEMERKGRFDAQAMPQIERFALNEYLVNLVKPVAPGPAADAFYGRVADLTGLPVQTAERTRGFVGSIYAKQAGGPGSIVSPYDAGSALPDAYPEASVTRNDDPVLDGYTRAYGAAFAAYARETLRFETPMTYTLLNEDVNRRWVWNGSHGGEGRATASASTDIRDLLSTIPSFRLMIAHGYSDILTPYGMSQYVLDHLPPDLTEGRTDLKVYRGGHMFYTRDEERRRMFDDARAFYEGGAQRE